MGSTEPVTPPRTRIGLESATVTSTHVNHGTAATFSATKTSESLGYGLATQWSRYSRAAVLINELLHAVFGIPLNSSLPPNLSTQRLASRLKSILTQSTDRERYRPFSKTANELLQEFYLQSPPTLANPAIMFVALGDAALLRHLRRTPDVVVVLRGPWEETVKAAIRKAFKHDLPELIKDSIESIGAGTKKVDEMTDDDLTILGVMPSWRIVVAVIEFETRALLCDLDRLDTPEDPPGASLSIRTAPNSASNTVLPPKFNSDGALLVLPKSSGPAQPASPSEVTTPKTLPPELQLMGYCNEIGSDGREHVTGAVVGGTRLRLISFDREGAIESSPIDLASESGACAFAQWVLALSTQLASKRQTLLERLLDADATLLGDMRIDQLEPKQVPYSIFGRCTTIFEALVRRGSGKTPLKAICKVSWQPTTRANEVDHINRARSLREADRHLPEVWADWTETTNPPSRLLGPKCQRRTGALEPREMRIMLMREYMPLEKLEGKKFLDAFKQIMRCYVSLYEAKLVQHGDISLGNMMYYVENGTDGEVIGVLNDWDLARTLGDEPLKASSQHRGGTLPFMARALLNFADLDKPQTIWHDLESSLYVLLFAALGYKSKRTPKADPLKQWRRGDPSTAAKEKRDFINTPKTCESILEMVLPSYAVLREPIRLLTKLVYREEIRLNNPDLPISQISVKAYFEALDTGDTGPSA